MKGSKWFLSSSLVAMVACGGAGDPPLFSADASAPDGAIDAGFQPDSSAGDASAPEASGPDTRIDPVSFVGQSWTYDVAAMGASPPCAPGSHTASVIGHSMVNGRDAFQVASFCAAAGTISYAIDGDRVLEDYQGSWLVALETPVAEGTSWLFGNVPVTWHAAGDVTVPAGTFHGCFDAKDTLSAGVAYATFCRGVGPVRWYYVDGSGNGYDAKLTARNF